ncbi:MAG: radical SAM protein, partial [Actinomycetia bacterium]|nr:radical SAM protein [Actinomycetes bacterium]
MARQRNAQRSVALVTLGCARNEVDSEELAARLGSGGWELAEPDDAAVVLVNTCGFIDAAKKDSIDTVLAAADTGRPVVAVGCLAERYGADLAQALPEADAVLGFDAYPRIADRLDDVLAGTPIVAHQPRDRRAMAAGPARRGAVAGSQAGGSETSERAASAPGAGGGAPGTGGSEAVGQSARGNQRGLPGHGWVRGSRVRLSDSPVAYLKLASGCDRRCAFCAIPSFRGGFVSRPPEDLVVEARWLASTGARELVLVSENSTSYGKDLGDLGALEALLPRLVAIDGVARVRVSYLQPAETRPPLIEAIATMAGVAPYFDLSFQHASAPVLRRMRRFGSAEDFLELLGRIRS